MQLWNTSKQSGKTDPSETERTYNVKKNSLGFIESVHENQWKVQQFSRPLAPPSAVFCFPSEPNIHEGPKYEK